MLSASVASALGVPERSSLGGVQRKRAETLALRLAEPMPPRFHLLPSPETLARLCAAETPANTSGADAVAVRDGLGRLLRFMSCQGDAMWAEVPPELDPATLLPAKRRQRKRQQMLSLLRACAVVALALDASPVPQGGRMRRRAVDFAGGCGHVGLLLAWLFPAWEVVCVDTKLQSLELGMERARACGLDNYSICHTDIRDFSAPFSLGVALHACGSASDFAIRACLEHSAAIVCAPCCVGKVGMGHEALCLAQSRAFRDAICAALHHGSPVGWEGPPESATEGEDREAPGVRARAEEERQSEAFVELAKAADFSDAVTGQEGWWRRLAKALVETDRLHFIREWAGTHSLRHGQEAQGGYKAVLCKMEPLEASPKNDVIVAWTAGLRLPSPGRDRRGQRAGQGEDLGEEAGVGLFREDVAGLAESSMACPARGLLIDPDPAALAQGQEQGKSSDGAGEPSDDVQERLQRLSAGAAGDRLVLDDVVGASRRKRVHAMAEALGLKHWSEGHGASRHVVVQVHCS